LSKVASVAADYLASNPVRPILWVLAIPAAWLIPWGLLVGTASSKEAR
jgi:hypothetical protein